MEAKLMMFMYSMECKVQSLKRSRLILDKRGFGMNELLGIAAAVILAAFIVIPGMKTFTAAVMKELTDWWDTVGTKIFPTT